MPRGKRLELSPRDIEIFRLLVRYRYLRSSYIHAFVGGASENRLKERLGDLFHEGYIGRPDQQWQFANCRHSPAVYQIDAGARSALQELESTADEPLTWLSHHGHRQFRHSLMICEVLASIDLGIRQASGVRLISWREILGKSPLAVEQHASPFEFSGVRIIPDALFGIEYHSGQKSAYRFCALEVDRGTMPVIRRNPEQSSYLQKIMGYRSLIDRRSHRTELGIPNLFVLTVTTSDSHLAGIIQAISDGTRSHSTFLFKSLCSPAMTEYPPFPRPGLFLDPWRRIDLPPLSLAS